MTETKRRLRTAVSLIFPAAVFFAICRVIYRNADKLRTADFDFNGPNLVAACVTAVASIYFLSAAWRLILRYLGGGGSNAVLEKMFVYSWVHRYLPGKIWTHVSRVYIGRAHDIGSSTLLVSSFVEQVASTLAHFLLALVCSAYLVTHYAAVRLDIDPRLALAVLPVVFAALHPKTLTFVFRLLFRRFTRDAAGDVRFLTGRQLIVTTAYYLVSPLLMSLSFVFLVLSCFRLSGSNAVIVFCVYMVVNFLAKVSLIAPAGMGVREGLLVLSLQPMMTTPVIAGIAVLSRIFLVLIDVFLVGAVFARDRVSRNG
jgi:uncharacterized membrane protein YbhN (UPF0104 family)